MLEQFFQVLEFLFQLEEEINQKDEGYLKFFQQNPNPSFTIRITIAGGGQTVSPAAYYPANAASTHVQMNFGFSTNALKPKWPFLLERGVDPDNIFRQTWRGGNR